MWERGRVLGVLTRLTLGPRGREVSEWGEEQEQRDVGGS